MAIKLSGFDELLKELNNKDIVYAGYSAAGCVLSPTLKGYHIVDNSKLNTYGDHKTIWEGLGFINWQFSPHFNSGHSETGEIEKVIEYFKKESMPYKTLEDGKVITIE